MGSYEWKKSTYNDFLSKLANSYDKVREQNESNALIPVKQCRMLIIRCI